MQILLAAELQLLQLLLSNLNWSVVEEAKI
jgi:hypothetical protein